MKLDVIEYVCNLLLMTFSISFPNMLRRIIEQNIFGKLYTSLFDLGMIINVKFLKCEGQNLRLIQVLVILMKFTMDLSLVIKIFR